MRKLETGGKALEQSKKIAPKLKRVLVFGITNVPGGTDGVILGYIRHFDAMKVHFDYICSTETMAHSDEVERSGSKVYYICNRRKSLLRHKRELKEFFRDHGAEYDAIWVNVSNLSDIDYFKYAKKYGIKKRIAHSHNTYESSRPRRVLHYLNKPWLAQYATDFWACSDRAGEWLYTKKIRSSDRYQIIHNAIDINTYKFDLDARKAYRERFRIASGEKVFIDTARLSWQKNQEFAITLFSSYYQQAKSGWLFLVGDGPDHAILEKVAAKLGVADRVKFLGTRNDIPQLLSMADVFLFPSRHEGLPLSLLEAQANGLKYIVIKDAISPSAFIIPENAIRIAESDEGIAKAVKRIDTLEADYGRSIDVKRFQKAHYDIDSEAKIVMRKLCE